MKRRRISIPPVWVVSVAFLVAAVTFCIRSRWRTDMVGFFPPSARLQAIVSERGGVLILLSEVPFDPQYGWSVKAISGSAQEFDQVRDAMIDRAAQTWHAAGLRYVQDQVSILGPRRYGYHAVVIPWAYVIVVFALLPLRRAGRVLARGRRRRTGACEGCGYDLRGSGDRCPECGRPIGDNARVARTAAQSCAIRPWTWSDRALAVLIVLAIIGLLQTYLNGWRQRIFEDRDLRAGFSRRVHDLDFEGTPLDRVLDALTRQTGARMLKSLVFAARQVSGFHGTSSGGRCWNSPIWAHFHDVSLEQALDVVVSQGDFVLPLAYESREDGTIFFGADDEMSQYVAVYDTRRLYRLLDHDPDPVIPAPWAGSAAQAIEYLAQLPGNGRSGDGFLLFPNDRFFGGNAMIVCGRHWQARIGQLFEELRAIQEPWPSGRTPELNTWFDVDFWSRAGR